MQANFPAPRLPFFGLFIVLFLGPLIDVSAQKSPLDCRALFEKEGLVLLKKSRYADAAERFRAAKACDDAARDDLDRLDGLIEKSQKAHVAELDQKRKDALAARTEADQKATLARQQAANGMAGTAELMLALGDRAAAAQLGRFALLLDPASIKAARALGMAIFHNDLLREPPSTPPADFLARELPICSAILRPDAEAVFALAFSPDGSRLATSDASGNVCFWAAETGFLQKKQPLGPAESHALAWSPDGKTLAAGNDDGQIFWIDAASGAVVFAEKNFAGRVSSLAFSADGKRLAAASWSGRARVFEVEKRSLLFEISDTERLAGLAFSPDGSRLATGGGSQILKIWDGQNGRFLEAFEKQARAIRAVFFDPDVDRFLALEEPSDAFSKKEKRPDSLAFSSQNGLATCLFFAEKGGWRGTGFADGRAFLAKKGAAAPFVGHEKGLTALAVSPDGERAATASMDGTARLWAMPKSSARTLGELEGRPQNLAFSPDQKRAAAVSSDQTITVFDLEKGEKTATLRLPDQAWSLAFSPDSRRLAAGGYDGFLHAFDLAQPAAAPLSLPSKQALNGLAFSKKTGLAAAAADSGQVFFFDPRDPSKTEKWTAHPQADARHVAFSPTADTLASSGTDRRVCLWKLPEKRLLRTFSDGFGGDGWSLAWSADGHWLAATGADSVRIWDVRTGKKWLEKRLGARLWSFVFSPDGQLAACAADGEAKVFRMPALDPVFSVGGAAAEVARTAFSPDGQFLATLETDAKTGRSAIRLWPLVFQKNGQKGAASFSVAALSERLIDEYRIGDGLAALGADGERAMAAEPSLAAGLGLYFLKKAAAQKDDAAAQPIFEKAEKLLAAAVAGGGEVDPFLMEKLAATRLGLSKMEASKKAKKSPVKPIESNFFRPPLGPIFQQKGFDSLPGLAAAKTRLAALEVGAKADSMADFSTVLTAFYGLEGADRAFWLARTLVAEGHFLFEKGEIDRAETSFLQASSLADFALAGDSIDFEKRQLAARADGGLAAIFLKKGAFEKADFFARKALRADGLDAAARRLFGIATLAAGRDGAALEHFSRRCAGQKKLVEADLERLGLAAKNQLLEAWADAPPERESISNGLLLVENQYAGADFSTPEARAALEKAVELLSILAASDTARGLRADFSAALQALGHARLLERRWGEAARLFSQSVQVGKGVRAEFELPMAHGFLFLGRTGEAKKWYEKWRDAPMPNGNTGDSYFAADFRIFEQNGLPRAYLDEARRWLGHR